MRPSDLEERLVNFAVRLIGVVEVLPDISRKIYLRLVSQKFWIDKYGVDY